ncbi:ABC transporter ATP-binding protein/permease [Actinoplanes bogorensis]|uniref:ABC transporter ATP-binding protein/permease n=1 Tax=Paractinoplanes bogorensis TaxID=1610840 RepID=A0ABS5Z5A4_9ACTN|nr:ABC transporter ATP-binding protein [Actinoplanes bogorensis]MBU2670874.1 ABC transporter ATP-binding protein/permease [Actinoplanes bogorensis]
MESGLGGLLRPVRGALVMAGALQVVSAVAGLVPFLAVAEIGRRLLAGETSELWTVAWWAVGGLLVRLVTMMASTGITHFADARLQDHVRREIARHLGTVPLGWFDARSSGEVKRAAQDDVGALHHLVGHAITDLVAAVVTPVAALVYLFTLDWRLSLLVLGVLPLFLSAYAVMMRGYPEKMAAHTAALGRINSAVVEFVQGIAVVKTFGQARRAHRRFLRATDDFADFFGSWAGSMIRVEAVASALISPAVMVLVVLGGGTWFVAQGWLAPVDVLPFVLLGVGLTGPVLSLGYGANSLRQARDAANRIGTVLAVPPLPITRDQEPQGNHVRFEGVAFSYDGRTEVLSGIDCVLEPGTVTALVGASGSGKSTLAGLVPRFFDATAGSVTIGGADVRSIDPDDLYRRVGFVFQDVRLLRATIRENIALGRPEATDGDVIAVARAAQIHDRITELPDGYDTVVGEGAHLSGGESQRVSIARALLADTPILVLDEATAFADPESEAAIQDALSTLVAGRTLLVIAHRLHTIAGADQILVLDQGRIVERGTHDDLLAAGGRYAAMVATTMEAAR